MGPLAELATRWRDEARTLRSYGADRLADAAERHAEQLEAAVRDHQHEELTVAEAARESGYSVKSLRRMVREDRIPDRRPDGSQAAIRIRRCDLPKKPAAERDPVGEAVARHVERAGTGGTP